MWSLCQSTNVWEHSFCLRGVAVPINITQASHTQIHFKGCGFRKNLLPIETWELLPNTHCNRVNLLPTLRFHGNDFVIQLTTKDIWIFIVQMKTSGTCFMQGSRSVQLPFYSCKSSNVFNSLTNLVSPRNLWEETAATDIPTCSCCGTLFIWSLHGRVRTLFLSIRVPLEESSQGVDPAAIPKFEQSPKKRHWIWVTETLIILVRWNHMLRNRVFIGSLNKSVVAPRNREDDTNRCLGVG